MIRRPLLTAPSPVVNCTRRPPIDEEVANWPPVEATGRFEIPTSAGTWPPVGGFEGGAAICNLRFLAAVNQVGTRRTGFLSGPQLLSSRRPLDGHTPAPFKKDQIQPPSYEQPGSSSGTMGPSGHSALNGSIGAHEREVPDGSSATQDEHKRQDEDQFRATSAESPAHEDPAEFAGTNGLNGPSGPNGSSGANGYGAGAGGRGWPCRLRERMGPIRRSQRRWRSVGGWTRPPGR